MADSWRDRPSRAARTARAVESMAGGSMKGRIAQASPVRPIPKTDQDPDDLSFVWVDDVEPDDAPQGKLWFKTDEPI